MPRFSDEWVIDRTLFEYVNGGSCACCGFNFFLPNGLEGLIQSMSDLETDAIAQEVAAPPSPWPVELRQQIWAERVRLRHYLKRHLHRYRTFWQEHGTEFEQWCHDTTTGNNNNNNNNNNHHYHWWKSLFQLSRLELSDVIRTQCNIHSAFQVVLDAVVEQVAFFPLTQYPTDSRSSSSSSSSTTTATIPASPEAQFEQLLQFDKRAGFTIPLFQKKNNSNNYNNNKRVDRDEEYSVNPAVLKIWLERMKSLGGPKLLERGPPSSSKATTTTTTATTAASGASGGGKKKNGRNDDFGDDDDDDDGTGGGADDAEDGATGAGTGTGAAGSHGFRSDRRLVRLIIARYWADLLMEKFLATTKRQQQLETTTNHNNNHIY